MTNPKKRKARSGSVTHVVRTADGRYRELRLTRKLAMAACCTECMGFEADPADCTTYRCPLWPFRARTQATLRGNLDQPKKNAGDTAQGSANPEEADHA